MSVFLDITKDADPGTCQTSVNHSVLCEFVMYCNFG